MTTGSGSGSGFAVNTGALDLAAEGVQGVIDELGKLGIDGEQNSGSPIENLNLSEKNAGSELISIMTGEVTGRAHYALRDILANASTTVLLLRATQSRYQKTDNRVAAWFDKLAYAFMGAPQ